MKAFLRHALVAVVLTSSVLMVQSAAQAAESVGQASATSNGQAPARQFAPGSMFRAQLDKTIDARKSKVGDPVLAKLTDDLKANGDVLAPRGSKVIGHLTQVKARQGDETSVVGIAFDKLTLKDGSDIPLKAAIQAIGFPETAAGAAGVDETAAGGSPAMRAPTPGVAGGSAGTVNQPGGYPGGAYPSGADTTNARLPADAKGVVGVPATSLAPGAAQETILSSQKHNVKVESGAQMILRVE